MNATIIVSLIFSLFLFFGVISLSAFSACLINMGKIDKGILLSQKNKDFPFFITIKAFLKDGWQDLYLLVKFTKNLVVILFVISSLLLFLDLGLSKALSIILITAIAISANFYPHLLGKRYYKQIVYICSALSTVYLIIVFPVTKLLLNLSKYGSADGTENMFSTLHDINMYKVIDPKFLSSLLTFQEKVAREVMIPRVQVFGLPANTTIRQASKEILSQGFSRIPVYKDKIDNIIGILMYKDVLKAFVKTFLGEEPTSLLDSPIESFITPVIYAPENKKIFQLFQEFRLKKRHLGIVVNEYGGTEGLITIEDILEELVGEIQDEYDIDEERQLWKLPNDSWIVDAKMSIIDLEKKLNIHIPHNPEYETIGGFIFHRAGSIPKKGWSLLLDEFEIEVLISNERCIEKVKITPLNLKTEEKEVQ